MRSGTYIALRDAVGGADLYFIKFGLVDTPIVLAVTLSQSLHGVRVRRFGARRRGLPEAQTKFIYPR